MSITQARLKELLDYDPDSGVFVHKMTHNNAVKLGQVAGVNSNGYIQVQLDKKSYYAHRLAWLYVHGTFPPRHIDHVNGVKSDNRIANLRPATHAENNRNRGVQSNNTSGWCGVYFNSAKGKYASQIAMFGKLHYLGRYDSPEIAAAVYAHVCQQAHGEFAKPDIPDWLIADSNTIKAIGGNMRQIAKCLAAVAIFNAQKEFA